jgi:SCP-2 sterol transfer family
MKKYATVRRLTGPRDADIAPTFRRMAELLRNCRATGALRCTILSGAKSRSWTLELRDRDCRLRSESKTAPDLEIITREETWLEIARGDLSPLDAFMKGRMRILGDTALGSRLLQHVAGSDGAVSICGG